ncbi:MAG: hypothetical protein JXM69_14975 [Anaerolineae bacterium]|nr:hypothetical protein [Anaerolineae bacterium]
MLKINVYAIPTEKHFDPQQVNFPIFTADGRIEHLIVIHPWRQHTQFRVCVGRIAMRDRKEKIVQVATYGGNLTISCEETRTQCALVSPAPLIELIDEGPRSPETTLFNMIEALLAERRAELGYDNNVYQTHLAAVDPLMLFLAGLVTLEEKFAQTPSINSQYQTTINTIHKTLQRLRERGDCPTSVPTLADLI